MTPMALAIAGVVTAALAGLALWAVIVYAPPPFSNTRYGLGTSEKRVALTFDDGPNAAATWDVLGALDRHAVKATFFLIAERAYAHPDMVRAMVERGHGIGFHFIEGADPASTPLASSICAIETFDAFLRDLGYQGVIPFRAPSLRLGLPLAGWLKRTGRAHIAGSALGWDWREDRQDGAVIARRVLRLTGTGTIIVLHDGFHRHDGADRSGVVAALDILLPQLKERGYVFVRVTD